MPTPDPQVDQKERWQSEGVEEARSTQHSCHSYPSTPRDDSGLSLLLGDIRKGLGVELSWSSTKDVCSVNTGCLFRNDTLPHGSFQHTPTAMGNSFCKSAQLWLDPEKHFHHNSESQATIHLSLGIIQARREPPLIPLMTACLKEEGCWKVQ